MFLFNAVVHESLQILDKFIICPRLSWPPFSAFRMEAPDVGIPILFIFFQRRLVVDCVSVCFVLWLRLLKKRKLGSFASPCVRIRSMIIVLRFAVFVWAHLWCLG